MTVGGCSSVPPISPHSQGSIVVDYDVILKTNYTPEYESTLDSIVKDLKTKIENATEHLVVDDNKNCSGKVLLEAHTLRELPIHLST